MDWKYKHFSREQTFPSSLEEVLEAARAYMSQSLGWRISEIEKSFTASGVSFAHSCIAHFHFQPAAGGCTHLRIELLVERASALGFMLVDVGGYYNIQMGHWLDGIQDQLRRSDSAAPAATAGAPPYSPPHQAKRPAALIFNGCLIFIAVGFGLYFLAVFVAACIGLLTGHFVWIGRGGTSTLHGTTARITSAIILVIFAFLIRRMAKKSK